MPNDDAAWWRDGVLYQIYVRSFADSNGDGIGDLRGVIEHLDHLGWLGVDGVWLSPVNPSPDLDWGYDVSDYRDVHPDLGDPRTLDELVGEAGSRGIRILLDLVPNHTSDRHPWFVDARSSRDAAHRDWYVWADPRADGSPPNNWRSVFGGSAWELDPTTGQYFLHNFLPEQPDLNWWNEQVRGEFDDILRFWFDRGIAGFRIDVANGLIHDPELRDNPAATEDDPPEIRRRGQRQVYNLNRPEVHEIYRGWRTIADGYDPHRILVAETWVFEPEQLARFYGTGDDELHLCFNFSLVFSDFRAEALGGVVRIHRGRAATRSAARLDGIEPRRGPVPDEMVRRPGGALPLRAHGAADAPRDPLPLLRRRDRDDGRCGARGRSARPGRRGRSGAAEP